MLSQQQIQQFKIDGYLVLPELLSPELLAAANYATQQGLDNRIEPFELEADVNYPGAPASSSEPGGDTIRRLLHAYQREAVFEQLARTPLICQGIQQILNCESVFLNPNHHNCVMTKQPQYSSKTLWHRDTRYWQFDNKYLINAWFALGEERTENGAMMILPGSHRWDVQDQALDSAQFLKLDHPFNQDRLATQRTVSLNAGDVLLFSAHCFHAAGKNLTDQAKFSLVYTYHSEQTKPLQNTRSATLPPISLT